MLPAKVFLESIRADPDRSVGSNKPIYKLNLVLNGIYYDELKQYHSKYLCVSANDVLTLELYAQDPAQLLGVTTIADLYKHVLDNSTLDVKLRPNDAADPELTIKLVFQTVAAYRRKSPSKLRPEDSSRIKPEDTKRADDSLIRSPPKEKER
jgi:hypothetical protein